jgi:hypothetical protein
MEDFPPLMDQRALGKTSTNDRGSYSVSEEIKGILAASRLAEASQASTSGRCLDESAAGAHREGADFPAHRRVPPAARHTAKLPCSNAWVATDAF